MPHAPWFKFYPSDWLGDERLRICSPAARCLWLEMMCVMHKAEPYGHLLVNGKPVTDTHLAALTSIPVEEVRSLLLELEDGGVFSRTRTRVIYSRRMTKDERRRKDGLTASQKANRRNAQHTENIDEKLEPPGYEGGSHANDPPSQIPEAREKERICVIDGEWWPRFRAAYPRRKGANPWKPARDKFHRAVKRGADPERIVAAAAAYRKQCEADGSIATAFVAQAMTWLNQERWDDELDDKSNGHAALDKGVIVDRGTPQWDAWMTHYREQGRPMKWAESRGQIREVSAWPPMSDFPDRHPNQGSGR